MREEQDGMMLIRAELCERLAAMQGLAARASIRDLAVSIGSLRSIAATYGMMPVVRLAEALERAMAEDAMRRSGRCPTALYLERLEDAIGCGRADDQASQAMLAS